MGRLRQIEAFVQVVERGSFVRAAEHLDLTPPVVTRLVQALEARLGVSLLARSTRKVRTTSAGQRYFEDCRRILSELGAAEESAQGSLAALRGEVSITAPTLFGEMHVLPVVLALLRQYPEVQARTLFVDRVVNLLEEGLDVAVRIGPLPDSSLLAARLGEVSRVVCATPEYLERAGRPEHPDRLFEHSLVIPGQVESWHRWSFGRGVSIKVTPRLVVNENRSAIQAVLAGLGLTRVLSYQVQDLLDQGRLVRVLDSFEPEPWPVHALYLPGRRAALVAALVTLLQARLG